MADLSLSYDYYAMNKRPPYEYCSPYGYMLISKLDINLHKNVPYKNGFLNWNNTVNDARLISSNIDYTFNSIGDSFGSGSIDCIFPSDETGPYSSNSPDGRFACFTTDFENDTPFCSGRNGDYILKDLFNFYFGSFDPLSKANCVFSDDYSIVPQNYDFNKCFFTSFTDQTVNNQYKANHTYTFCDLEGVKSHVYDNQYPSLASGINISLYKFIAFSNASAITSIDIDVGISCAVGTNTAWDPVQEKQCNETYSIRLA